MADEADVVQPDEGQGGGSEGTSPYAEYLERIPEEVRDQVEPVFRDWDANTTRRFQESSEFRKAWEPYEQIGVNQHDPEAVKWGLEMREAAINNPQAVAEWYQQYAQQYGLNAAEEQLEAIVDPDVERLVNERLQQQLGPIAEQLGPLLEWRDKQEQERAEKAAAADIERQLEELKIGPEERARVEMFVPRHMNDPEHAIQKAVEDFRNLQKQIESDWVKAKSEQPDGAERGGRPDGTPDPVNSLQEAGRIALERLRQAER
jgi:flagellar biosynthesis/type III secretory pathway chaperone